MPADASFLVDQPYVDNVAATLVPGTAVPAAGGATPMMRVPAYRGKSVGTPGYAIDHVMTSQYPDERVQIAVTLDSHPLCAIDARGSFLSPAAKKTLRNSSRTTQEIDEMIGRDIAAEAPTLIRSTDGTSVVAAIKTIDKFKGNALSQSMLVRSVVIYSTTPRFDGQTSLTLDGLDLQEVFPWAKVTGTWRLMATMDRIFKTGTVHYATPDGFESQPTLTINPKEKSDMIESRGAPQPFTVTNQANEGVAIARVKESKADKLVWHQVSLASGVDASMIAAIATSIALLNDRLAFERGRTFASLGF